MQKSTSTSSTPSSLRSLRTCPSPSLLAERRAGVEPFPGGHTSLCSPAGTLVTQALQAAAVTAQSTGRKTCQHQAKDQEWPRGSCSPAGQRAGGCPHHGPASSTRLSETSPLRGHCPAELPWVLGGPWFGRPQGDHALLGHQEGSDAAEVVLVRCDPSSATRPAQNPARQAVCRPCGLQASRPPRSREGSFRGASTGTLAAAPTRDTPG